jgi:hypothetical protein
MHPDQFQKLMDPEEDPFQKPPPEGGGDVMTSLQNIPPFGSVYKNGLTLLLDPSELARLNNPFVGRYDQGPATDIAKGYEVWRNNMLGREAFLSIGGGSEQRKDWPGTGDEALSLQDVLLKAGARPVRPQDVGESFYPQNNIWMVPALMRYHKAPLDRREYNTTPLAFRIAAGLHQTQQGDGTVGTRDGDQGYYKKFEPQSYYKFGGLVPEYQSRLNEARVRCRRPLTNETMANVKPDRIILSHKTHNFVKDPVDEATLDQNMRSQTTNDPSRNLKAGDTPNKCGRGMQRHNYAANMTIHRTCPKGYVIWQPPANDPMFEKVPTVITAPQFAAICKGEKLW